MFPSETWGSHGRDRYEGTLVTNSQAGNTASHPSRPQPTFLSPTVSTSQSIILVDFMRRFIELTHPPCFFVFSCSSTPLPSTDRLSTNNSSSSWTVTQHKTVLISLLEFYLDNNSIFLCVNIFSLLQSLNIFIFSNNHNFSSYPNESDPFT